MVPLVALLLDLIRRSHELGIAWLEWRSNHPTRASLMFISVEAVGSNEGRAYLYQLYHAGQLDRIVVDEFHLIL